MTKINTGNANREYKDRLFRFVFGAEENKAYLLSLCNAVSGTDYTDVDDIEITTLSDAIYIKMKNDISFLCLFVVWNILQNCMEFILQKMA